MTRALVLLIAACGGNRVEPHASLPYCPPTDSPWASELFPGCQPLPFSPAPVTLCGGKACALPCRITWSQIQNNVTTISSTEELVYNARDRYVGYRGRDRELSGDTLGPPGDLDNVTTYDAAGRVATSGHETAVRDGSGRLTSTDFPELTLRFTYDSQGRPDSFGGEPITYDNAGRLTSYDRFRIEWENDRVVREYFGDGSVATLTYDASNRPIAKAFGGGHQQTVEYDGDRVIAFHTSVDGTIMSRTFAYSCAASE